MRRGVSLSSNLSKQPYTQKPLQAKQMLSQQPLVVPQNMFNSTFGNQQQQFNTQLSQIQQLKKQFKQLHRMVQCGKQNLCKIRHQKQMIQISQEKQWRQGNVELQMLKQQYKQMRTPFQQNKLCYFNIDMKQMNRIEDKLEDLIDLND